MIEKISGILVHSQNTGFWTEALANDSCVLENFYRHAGLVFKAAVTQRATFLSY